MKLSKVAIKRLVLLLLAIACLGPAMPAAAGSELPTRAQGLAALAKSDPAERRRGALGLAAAGRMEDAPALAQGLRRSPQAQSAALRRALGLRPDLPAAPPAGESAGIFPPRAGGQPQPRRGAKRE